MRPVITSELASDHTADKDTDQGAVELVRRLDGYPVALASAGAFLKHSHLTFAEYLHRYERSWKASNRRARSLPEYSGQTLNTTWMMSLDRLRQEDYQAAELLMLLAYFDNSNITYELLQANKKELPGWFSDLRDFGTFADVMALLSEYCLVEARPQDKSYGLHVCVQDWLLEGVDSTMEEQQQRYAIALNCTADFLIDVDVEEFRLHRYSPIAAHALRLVNVLSILCFKIENIDVDDIHCLAGLGVLLKTTIILAQPSQSFFEYCPDLKTLLDLTISGLFERSSTLLETI